MNEANLTTAWQEMIGHNPSPITPEILTAIWEEIAGHLVSIPGFGMTILPEEAACLNFFAKSPVALGVTVELGAYYGGGSVALGLGCKSIGQQLISVDTWRGTTLKPHWQWMPGEDIFQAWAAAIWQAGLTNTVLPLVGMFDDVLCHWRWPIRLLYSDGYHTYEAVKHDVETWSPHIHHGGMLLIHDYKSDPPLEGVDRYVDELAASGGRFTYLGCIGRIAIFQADLDKEEEEKCG